MKVVITKCTNNFTFAVWWYEECIGEEFEVEDDPEMGQYYFTSIEGSPHKHHILKDDCEIVN